MAKKKQLFKSQKQMRQVEIALLPCIFGSVYFFGWRSLAAVAVSCLTAFIVEYIFSKKRNDPVTEAAFVTGILYALTLPPNIPWHVLIIGIAFGIMFGKEVFGGFGRNIFNPALVGRCFIYISFPIAMTAQWAPSAPLGGMGALAQWSTAAPDTITTATPMAIMKATGEIPAIKDLFLGGLGGSAGVTSAVLILIGGLYLFWNKTASRTTIITVIITYGAITQTMNWLGVKPFPPALPALLGAGFLFGAFFMATDPVSSPRTEPGKIFYGIIIGLCATVIRNFSVFNGGLMFAILIGNMFAPIIDYAVKAYQDKGKEKAKETA